MRSQAPDQTTDALHPVRAELLRAAHADAEALLSRADQEAYMAWRTETGLIAQIVDKLGGAASFGFYDTVYGETIQR